MQPSAIGTRSVDLLRNGIGPIGAVTWNGPVADPDIDQLLHGLEVPIGEQAIQLPHADEEAETAVQVRATGFVEMPERVDEVGVVEVGVDAKHLAPGGAHVAEEGLGEADGFAEPVAAGEVGEGAVEGCGACWDGFVGGARGGGDDGGVGGFEGGGGGPEGGICGECDGVVDLADDPALDEHDVLGGRHADGLALVVEPGIDVVTAVIDELMCYVEV